MSYSFFPLVTRGDLWSAADHNTYIKDNFAETEPAKVTTAGDMVYADAAGSITRLGLSAGRIMTAGSAAPSWLAIGDPFAKLRSKYLPSDGVEWKTFPPGEIVTRSTAQAIPHNTTTEIVFDAAQINEYGMWSAGQPHKVIIPFFWYYQISGYLLFQTPNTSIHRINNVRYDSAGVWKGIGPGRTAVAGGTGRSFKMSFSMVTTNAAGDQTTLAVRQNSGSTMNVYYAKMSVVAMV